MRAIRFPLPLNENVSHVMSANRSTNTGPERMVRERLTAMGLKGYRLNWKKAPGKPDVAFVKKKIAIFVNGCFWHGCSKCQTRKPKNNSAYWIQKFERNRKRDKGSIQLLKSMGWRTFVVRECEIKNGKVEKILKRVVVEHKKGTL
jgi:DNA mismatch endonuclease (patch repair protein)